jgi:menaquinone-dependent protoporphyrinogen IX oxidase
MDRRTFFRTVVAGGGAALLVASQAHALRLFPNTGKQKWAVLFGSRYGTARDASVWISEGMGGIADAFDARENPDLSSFEAIVVGSGIYLGKIDTLLEDYLAKNAPQFSSRIRALFLVCGAGDTPRGHGFLEGLTKACGVKPPLTRVFPGRLTRRLLNAADYKVEEGVAKRQNQPYEDYDRLQRKDCLKFGEEILAKG